MKISNLSIGTKAIALVTTTCVLGACSTTSRVKTSAQNPAPITYKVASVADYSAYQSGSRVGTQQSLPTLPYTAPKPGLKAAPRASLDGFDTRGIDKQLYAHQKVGRTYTINGVKYKPAHNPDYDETGIASWYGPNFHGKLTANGETYNKNGLTAAHKTLPLNSNVYVTNLENGKSMMVRLNDRGPFVEGRIIDLSYGAAKQLGVTGLAKIRVQYAGPADMQGKMQAMRPAPQTAQPQSPQVAVLEAPVQQPRSIVTPKPVELAPTPAPQTAQLIAPVPQNYQPLSVIPRVAVQQDAPKAPGVAAPAAPLYVAPNTPYSQTDAARPRQVFAPPASGGVMTMTITGPIHMASTEREVVAKAKIHDNRGQYIQAATFSSETRARSSESALSKAGPVSISNLNRNGQTLHRVLVGPYDSDNSVSNALSVVNGLGYLDAKIIALD